MTDRSPAARRSGSGARPPLPVAVAGALAGAVFVVPLVALAVRAPWSQLGTVVTGGPTRQALVLSMVTASLAALVSFVLGVPLAWLLARTTFPGRRLVRSVCTLSMVLPPVVGGVALFLALGRRGLLGGPLDSWFGVRLPFTTPAVVVAQVFVAMPFLVLTVEAAIAQLDVRFEDAARTLGASEWTVFRRVVLPSVRPALLAGVALTWARALGEFGATITFAGSLPGVTRTMPLETYLALESDLDRAVLLSLVLVAVSLAVLVGLRSRWVGALAGGGPT